MVVTPHFPQRLLLKIADWKSLAQRPYIQLLRDLSVSYGLAIADGSRRWEHFDREGLRAGIMLVNKVNNPNSRGHEIYAEEILRCFSY